MLSPDKGSPADSIRGLYWLNAFVNPPPFTFGKSGPNPARRLHMHARRGTIATIG